MIVDKSEIKALLDQMFETMLSDGKFTVNEVRAVLDRINITETAEIKCTHNSGILYSGMDHITCRACRMIQTDSGWGIASNKWFKSVAAARFYQKNGRLPE